MLILLSSCFLQVEKSTTFKLIPLSQRNCFLGGTGRDVLSNILHASQLMGWQGGELLSGNIVTWVGVRVQLQPMIFPLLITFVKVDFEILMTGTRINVGEIFNCSLNKETNLMLLALLFHYLMLNMFQMLIHPSSGACDLFVELFRGLYCSGSMCVGVTSWFASACIRIPHHPSQTTT